MESQFNSSKFREIVLNVERPVIIRNVKIPWKSFNISLKEWCNLLQNETSKKHSEIIFEIAKAKHFDTPQWEKYRKEQQINMDEFLEGKSKFFEEYWACLSYRNILELPKNLQEDIDFSYFGFPEINNDDTTFWLNSKNSNTPCHYDSYGCNIVVQVHGRKSWLLFPPDSPLKSIRIPYEESSVYCSENFYSPNNLDQFNEIKDKCFKCILEKGDILIVPRKWWHYVESLEASLSFNHWIPLEVDLESQLDECIAKYFIERFLATDSESTILEFLNPNQVAALTEESEILCILEKLCNETLQKKNQTKDSAKKLKKLQYPYMYLDKSQIEDLFKDFQCDIQYVKNILVDEFLDKMRTNSSRFIENSEREQENKLNIAKIMKEILINSICNPKIISSIRKLLLEHYNKRILI